MIFFSFTSISSGTLAHSLLLLYSMVTFIHKEMHRNWCGIFFLFKFIHGVVISDAVKVPSVIIRHLIALSHLQTFTHSSTSAIILNHCPWYTYIFLIDSNWKLHDCPLLWCVLCTAYRLFGGTLFPIRKFKSSLLGHREWNNNKKIEPHKMTSI